MDLKGIPGTEHLRGKVLCHIRKGDHGELVFCFGDKKESTEGQVVVCNLVVDKEKGTAEQVLYLQGTWKDSEEVVSKSSGVLN